MSSDKPTRFNADLHFIAPFSLDQCRTRLRNIRNPSNRGKTRFFKQTPMGIPFEVGHWTVTKERPDLHFQKHLLGYLKWRNEDSTYVTIYAISKATYKKWLIGVLLSWVLAGGIFLMEQGLGSCCMIFLVFPLVILGFSYFGEYSWVRTIKEVLMASDGHHLLEADGLLESSKDKNIGDIFPDYQQDHFSDETEEMD